MSTQFEVPGASARPTTVTMAAYSQFGIGGISLIATVLQIVQTNATVDAMRRELTTAGVSSQDVDSIATFTSVFTYGTAFVALMFAAAVAIMGVFNLRGKNGARVTTWVLAGIGLLCGICGSIGGLLGSLSTGSAPNGTGESEELVRAMERAADSIPGWYSAVNLALTVLSVVLYLAIIILLAVPASNDFFRKPKSAVDVLLPPEAYTAEPQPPKSTPEEPSGPEDQQPPK